MSDPVGLRRAGMICSMSPKGNCWDNAPTESYFNSLTNEPVHSMRCTVREEATNDLFEYIGKTWLRGHLRMEDGKQRKLKMYVTLVF